MQTLAIADEVVPLIYSLRIKQRFSSVRLILSCGDLPYYYLEFIVTMLGVPCLYIHGNHDGPERTSGGDLIAEPRGCTCLESQTTSEQGLVFAGLGGSIRYNRRGGAQYSEGEMLLRAWRLAPRLFFNRLRHGRYLDVLLTHAPPHGIHNGPDRAHRGFKTFLHLMQHFAPRYLIHGHIHRAYNFGPQTDTHYHQTCVINTAGYRLLDLQPAPPLPR